MQSGDMQTPQSAPEIPGQSEAGGAEVAEARRTTSPAEMRAYNEQRANGLIRVGSSYLFGSGN